MNLSVIILAAGKGTRMKSNIPKTLHKVGNKTMIEHVVDTAQSLNPDKIIVVVSENNREEIKNTLNNNKIKYVIQKSLSGTASAVLAAQEEYKGNDILVLLGDVPLISIETLQKIINNKGDGVILGYEEDNDHNKFGRLFLKDNQVVKIIEYNEASEEERKIRTVNSGMLFLKSDNTHLLEKIENNNSKEEYYLTDIVEIMTNLHKKIMYVEGSKTECIGVNTREDLDFVNQIMR